VAPTGTRSASRTQLYDGLRARKRLWAAWADVQYRVKISKSPETRDLRSNSKMKTIRAATAILLLYTSRLLASDRPPNAAQAEGRTDAVITKEYSDSLVGTTAARLEVIPKGVSYAVEPMDGWFDGLACFYDAESSEAVSALTEALRSAILEVHPVKDRKPVAATYAIKLSSGLSQKHSIYFILARTPDGSGIQIIGGYDDGILRLAPELTERLEAWRRRPDVRLTRKAPSGDCAN
jgi:hypothetical protein